MRRQHRARALSLLLLVLMATQATLGLTLHGEYRDAAWIVATWWGNDWVTLALGVPLLGTALVLSKRGSTRGLLLWAGVLAYAAYNYAYYLLGAALNRFFALYVVCAVVSVSALVMVLANVDARAIASRFSAKTPVRLVGGYLMFTAVGLSAVWLGMWAAYAFAGRPTPVETEAFHLVAALDLTTMVPVLALGGYLLFRRRDWGYVTAALGSIQATLYLLVLSVNSVIAIQRGLVEAPGELPIWGPLLLGTVLAAGALLAHVSDSAPEKIAE
jgi:hypothetical protein